MTRTHTLAVALVVLSLATTLIAEPIGFEDAVSWWRLGNDLTDSAAPPASDGSVTSGSISYIPVSGAGYASNGVAATFDADRVRVPVGAGDELDTNAFTEGLTVFARIDPDVYGSGQCLVNRDGYNSAERVFSLEISTGSTTSRVLWRAWADTSDNKIDHTAAGGFANPGFHDVVGVFRPGVSSEVYIDGELWDSRVITDTTLVPGGTVPVAIGNRAFTNYPYHGDMESAAVWNQALDPIDIKRLTEGHLNQTHAATWIRFDGDFADSNGPPTTVAAQGTTSNPVTIVANASAPQHMGNGQVARFPGFSSSNPNGPYLNLGLGASNELDIDGSNGFTVFARVYPEVTGGPEIVCRDGFPGYSGNYNLQRSFAISCFGSRGPLFRVWDGMTEIQASATTSGYPTDYVNNWHDLVGIFRPGEAIEFWMDGVLMQSTPTTALTINTPAGVPITIGRRYGTGTSLGYFDGDIESVAFWAYDLSPAEIQRLSVPEPATLSLVAAGLLALARRRRRN